MAGILRSLQENVQAFYVYALIINALALISRPVSHNQARVLIARHPLSTLKSERFYRSRFDSVEQLQGSIRQYIHYYNHHRIKTKLKGLSPVQYRTQAFST
ncbi:hypothetical protein D6I95_13900 [Alcaligenes faecalis]|nr:hypothetical protein D6I95_13900 [Alcaligenes faecalis]